MKLSKNDAELFFKLHPALLFYANQRLGILKGVSTLEEFREMWAEDVIKVRDALYDRMDLIDSFVKENPFDFSPEELEIVFGWKDLIKGSFFLLRYLKEYAIFLEGGPPSKAYGVLALNTTFEEMLGPELPIFVKAVLLPFKGRIVYDGFFVPHRIVFGGNIRRSLNDDYREAEWRFGIITSLPFSRKEKEKCDADRLRFYLKSGSSRERHREEIEKLINKDRGLLALYHREMGKIQARRQGRHLRELWLRNSWFAILDDTIVASGTSRAQVEGILNDILPTEKRDFVHIFQLK